MNRWLYFLLLPVGADGFAVNHRAIPLTTGLAATSSSQQEGATKKGVAPSVENPEKIRNLALVGHSHSGKTSLAEWMLYEENMLPKVGSFLDSDHTEATRHSSIFSHFCRVPHKGYLLEASDTPWGDYPSAAISAADGADSALLVASAADGVQSGLIHAYEHCQQTGIPCLLCLNKMDRPFVQVEMVLEDIEKELGKKPVPLQSYVFDEDKFVGVEPLLNLDRSGSVCKSDKADEEAWMVLEEAVAMTDDDLLVEYLENSELSTEQVVSGLQRAIRQGSILPVVFTSAEADTGIQELMDAVVTCLPSPIDMRSDVLQAACESEEARCALQPGVEAGFAARVVHTTVDSFGSLSILRVISNSCDDDSTFESLPHEVVVLRSGDKIKMPSVSNTVALCGRERQPLVDGAPIVPGDVIAVPKLPEAVHTNDILAVPGAIKQEKSEIEIETLTDHLSPLSRQVEDVSLMAAATVSLSETRSKGGKGKSGAGGDDKLLSALKSLSREDLALRVDYDASGNLILHCMSSDHLKIISERLTDRYGLEVEFGVPPVPYKETISKHVKNIEGRHKKQSGGSGQFGVCVIDMEPLEEGQGVEFESRIKGGVISKPFISSVEKGVREQLKSGGLLGGYPVTDVKVSLVDGKMHSVDSKDIAFQSAGRQAVKAALEKGRCRLLQPMEQVTFQISQEMRGEINTIVARGDGYVTSTDSTGTQVEAILPTASLGHVSDVLRAASGGEAQYTSEFSHYQPVPDEQVSSIVEDS